MQFAILTDAHCVPTGETLFGLDSLATLRAAVERLNGDHPGLEFVVLLGDLTNAGDPDAYAGIAEALAPLSAPVIPMVGNHDLRAPFRDALPMADRDPNGFVQALRVFDDASVLTRDTLHEGEPTSASYLCQDRLASLEASLNDAPADRPLMLFQHHPPFDTGIPRMDRIRLRNAEEEWEVIARSRRPDYLFIGHVHRPISGLWHGIPFQVQRALAHQVALDFVNTDGVVGSYQAPEYSVVTVGAEGIVVHQAPVFPPEPSFNLRDPAAQRRSLV